MTSARFLEVLSRLGIAASGHRLKVATICGDAASAKEKTGQSTGFGISGPRDPKSDAGSLGFTSLAERTAHAVDPERKPRPAGEAETDHGAPEGFQLDVLDPMNRVVGELRPPGTPPALVPASTLDRLAQEMVKRLSMSGNGKAGTVRLEFGGGLLEGGHLVVSCDGADINLILDAPSALSEAELSDLVEGMKARFNRRGLSVGEFEVRR